MNPLFLVENLCFSYPNCKPSLVDVSFSVQTGERLALIGANGSGKSTLLHLLDGLHFPTSGSIKAFGQLVTEESLNKPPFGPRFRSEVGFMFQNSDVQLFCATVEDELAFGPLQLKLPKAEIERRIEDTLNLLQISHLRQSVPQRLSVGQKKMVALASVLVVGPSVLLLDEPTAGLDPRSQSMLLEILQELSNAGITLITATHDLSTLPHLADRALVLTEEHTLAADAPALEVLEDIDLLLAVNLIHAHTHKHGTTIHSHPHHHVIAHEHQHE